VRESERETESIKCVCVLSWGLSLVWVSTASHLKPARGSSSSPNSESDQKKSSECWDRNYRAVAPARAVKCGAADRNDPGSNPARNWSLTL